MEAYEHHESPGVHPDFQHHGVGRALLEQLVRNLNGLGLTRLRTEVNWDDQQLLHFFHHAGFTPAPRLCLELGWESHDPRSKLTPR